MPSLVETLRLNPERALDLENAAEILRKNGTVAFPTETVYGLGANALSAVAVEKIFLAKQRPHWDPLIVHIASELQLADLATSLTSLEEDLTKIFWPGPLTLLLRKTDNVPAIVTAGRSLVGVRMPAHPVALALLRRSGLPIAAPSANTFGHTSPTTAAHVLADLDGRIDAVLDGGSTKVGVESTVVEVRLDEVVIYRQGAITEAMIYAVRGVRHVRIHQSSANEARPETLPSPGVGIRHYAPHARLLLVSGDHEDPSQEPRQLQSFALIETIRDQASRSESVGVLLPDGWAAANADHVFAWGSWSEPEQLAHRLYAGLRYLDDRGCSVIVAPRPPSFGISGAIVDRLEKASRTT